MKSRFIGLCFFLTFGLASGAALKFTPGASARSQEENSIYLDGPQGSVEGTVCAWIKLEEENKSCIIAGFGGHYRGHYWGHWYLQITLDGKLQVICSNGRFTFYKGTTEQTIPVGEWHHVAIVINRERGKTFYVDAKPVRSTWHPRDTFHTANFMATRLVLNKDKYFKIGISPREDGNTITLADVRAYERALGQSEVGHIFKSKGTDEISDKMVGRWVGTAGDGATETEIGEFSKILDASKSGNDLYTRRGVFAVESILDKDLPDYLVNPPKPLPPPEPIAPPAPPPPEPVVFPGEIHPDPPIVQQGKIGGTEKEMVKPPFRIPPGIKPIPLVIDPSKPPPRFPGEISPIPPIIDDAQLKK